MLSIYKYIKYDTFGQCFIALNFANHEVYKAKDWYSGVNHRGSSGPFGNHQDPLEALTKFCMNRGSKKSIKNKGYSNLS